MNREKLVIATLIMGIALFFAAIVIVLTIISKGWFLMALLILGGIFAIYKSLDD